MLVVCNESFEIMLPKASHELESFKGFTDVELSCLDTMSHAQRQRRRHSTNLSVTSLVSYGHLIMLSRVKKRLSPDRIVLKHRRPPKTAKLLNYNRRNWGVRVVVVVRGEDSSNRCKSSDCSDSA